jgi:quinol monooxygenase YgiN
MLARHVSAGLGAIKLRSPEDDRLHHEPAFIQAPETVEGQPSGVPVEIRAKRVPRCRRRSTPPVMPKNVEIRPILRDFGFVCASGSARCTPYGFRCYSLVGFWKPLDQTVSTLTIFSQRRNRVWYRLLPPPSEKNTLQKQKETLVHKQVSLCRLTYGIAMLLMVFTTSTGFAQKEDMMVRISEIEIHSAYIDQYRAILKEEAGASVRLEPGVIAIFPMYQKAEPTQVRILEIYATREAYESHLRTPHFQRHKTTTLNMVKSLKLIDMETLDPETMSVIFQKLKRPR